MYYNVKVLAENLFIAEYNLLKTGSDIVLKIGIIPNLGKEDCKEVFSGFCALLEGKAEVFVTDEVFSLPVETLVNNRKLLENLAEEWKVKILEKDRFFEHSDVVVVMGGDGSILRAASDAAKWGKPLLGINLGRVGYLASAEKTALETVAEQLVSGNYTTEEHLLLSTENDGKDILALNDVVISRSEMGRILEFSVYVDEDFVDNYTADGVVIATPTGSTAYSLSAGGPVAYPYMDMLIITPVCAHGLSARPIVVPADKKITLKMGNRYDYKALVSADGQIINTITADREVTVKKASVKVKLIKANNYGFYDILRYKLKGETL